MQTLLLIYLFAVVCWARFDSNQENIETLMDNGISLFILYLIFPPQLSKICTNIHIFITVVVLRVPYDHGIVSNVPLTCGQAYINKPIFWKKNGNHPPISLCQFYRNHGNAELNLYFRSGADSTSGGQPGNSRGDGDGWRKLLLSPGPRQRVPEPHGDPGPTGSRQQDGHFGKKVPRRRWDWM